MALQRILCPGVVVRAGARFLYNSDDLIDLKLAMVGAHSSSTRRNPLGPGSCQRRIRRRVRESRVLQHTGGTEGHAGAGDRNRALPRNYAALLANFALNGLTNVRCVQRILWRESGRELALHVVAPYNLGANSVLGTGATEAVSTSISLDDLMRELRVDRIDVMKIEVEGAELESSWALPGASASSGRFLVFAADNHDEPTRREAVDLITAARYQVVYPFTSAVQPPRTFVGRSLLFFERVS